jgi:hypothetical protein
VMYLDDTIRAPKRWGRERHGLDGARFEVERKRGLETLREWLGLYNITGLFDVL